MLRTPPIKRAKHGAAIVRLRTNNRPSPRMRGSSTDPVRVPAPHREEPPQGGVSNGAGTVGFVVRKDPNLSFRGDAQHRTRNPVFKKNVGPRVRAVGSPRGDRRAARPRRIRNIPGDRRRRLPESRAEPREKSGPLRSATFDSSGKRRARPRPAKGRPEDKRRREPGTQSSRKTLGPGFEPSARPGATRRRRNRTEFRRPDRAEIGCTPRNKRASSIRGFPIRAEPREEKARLRADG